MLRFHRVVGSDEADPYAVRVEMPKRGSRYATGTSASVSLSHELRRSAGLALAFGLRMRQRQLVTMLFALAKDIRFEWFYPLAESEAERGKGS